MVVKNDCGLASIYGPFEQTLFLGCSIMSYSASTGWNNQVTELTVQLVEDPCSLPKVYYDNNLQKVSSLGMADPGFVGLDRWKDASGNYYSGVIRTAGDELISAGINIIGLPVYFRVADFEFAGLVQSFEQASSSSGRPTYSVKLVDPRQILEGAQIILGEYTGGVGLVANIFNPFGAMEIFGTWAQQIKLDGNYPTYLSKYALTVDDGSALPVGDDGAIFGSFPQGFGGASTTNNGIQWSVLKTGLNLLLNSIPTAPALGLSAYSPYGRLRFRGLPNSSGAYGLIKCEGNTYAEYYVDLSEIPTMPADWRIGGTDSNLLSIIETVCDAAGCDFYIELILVADPLLSSTGIAKFIKIRVVKRYDQPTLGFIPTFIGTSDGLIDSTYGQELRNEVTASFIIGGKKNTLYQVEQTYTVADPDDDGPWQDDAILPYFGIDDNYNAIIPTKDTDGDWQFYAPHEGIDIQFLQMAPFNTPILITELELQAALSGKDSWIAICSALNTQCGQKLASLGVLPMVDANKLLEIFNDMLTGEPKGRDYINAVEGKFLVPSVETAKEIEDDIDALFNFVQTYANEYYGKKFQVRVPYGYAPIVKAGPAYHRLDISNYQVLTCDDPTDEGWTEQPYVLGLPNYGVTAGTAILETFRRDNKKIGSFCRIDNATMADKSLLDQKNYIVYDGALFINCKVEEQYVYVNKSTLFSPRAVIELDQQIREKVLDESQATRLILKMLHKTMAAGAARDAAEAKIEKSIEDVGGKSMYFPLMFSFMMPDAVAIGIQSNTMNYGPWWRTGPYGQVRIQYEEGLVPWEYGSYSVLNTAGFALAQEAITNMQVGEMGKITVPGYPQYQLGYEIGAATIGAGQSVINSRTATTSVYSNNFYNGNPLVANQPSVNMGGAWTGITGPNITDITVDVGENGVQTTYTFRTYTPKFGRFAKLNADRLKQNSAFRAYGQSRIRNWLLYKMRLGINKSNKQKLAHQRFNFHGGETTVGRGAEAHAGTPHEMFVGESTTFRTGVFSPGGSRRNIIETLQMKEFGNELKGYDHKAFMSFDGLIRPISMAGDGGLPRYATRIGTQCSSSMSEGAQPPVGTNSDATDLQYNTVINNLVLNPFENPTSAGGNFAGKLYATGLVDTDDGHDIDILGRGDTAPTGHMAMPYDGYSKDGYSDYYEDYRAFALRGPLLVQGWGYDLNGKPIPNKIDNVGAASSGTFAATGLQCKFLDNFLRKPQTWPVGPVDLRWDRKRAVWTVPQQRFLVGIAQESISGLKSGIIKQLYGDGLYDCDGNDMSSGNNSPKYYAYDVTSGTISSGDRVITYYDSQLCRHHIFGGSSNSDNKISHSGILCYIHNSGYSLATTPISYNNLIFGEGFGVYKKTGEYDNTAHVALELSVNDETVNSISFTGSCWDIKHTGCETNIGFAGSGGTVTVVTNVWCSGASIHISTTGLLFQCGLYKGMVDV